MRRFTEKRITDMTNEKKQKLIKLIGDLGWDYDRMSSSGQQVYNELCDLLGIQ
jgi:hypothetical protein